MAQSRVDLAQQLISLDEAMTTKYADAFRADVSAVDTALADYHTSGPAAPDAQIAELEANWQKFADVGTASEVKDLAQETARATEDISRRVEAIQADTGGAVIAIEEITRVIARISDFQTTIASAVEEQTATTAEMSRSVSEAATGTNEISQNITGVAEAARLTTEGVQQSQQATGDRSRMSAELTSLVSTFRY
jgi:uncharacterized phage infection (PIP) family protein YhgE